MSDDKKHISIVVAGHVDAGKSSLTGRLLYDMGGIDERMMEKLNKKAIERSRLEGSGTPLWWRVRRRISTTW
jgi:translation elongation factor EF-1alpha